jgi:hypothetical protein
VFCHFSVTTVIIENSACILFGLYFVLQWTICLVSTINMHAYILAIAFLLGILVVKAPTIQNVCCLFTTPPYFILYFAGSYGNILLNKFLSFNINWNAF